MDFDDAAAERLEAVYSGEDIVAQRRETLRRLALRTGEAVLDIGSGPGFLCQEMAAAVGSGGRVKGIDISPAMVRRAAGRNPLSWVSFAEGNATALPEADQSYDVIVSTQVAEYVADIGRFCSEAHRVLKPGGRGVIMATDWDSIVWHSDDPVRMQRVLQAYAPHSAHNTLPRTLGSYLRDAGFLVGAVAAYPIINTDFTDGRFSREMVRFITSYILGNGSLPPSDLDAWEAGLRQLAEDGRYFFALNRYVFSVERPPEPDRGLR